MVKGAAVQPTIKTEDRFTTVTVPTNGSTEVVMMYTVTGVVVTIDSGTALALADAPGPQRIRDPVHRNRADPDPVQLHQVHGRQPELHCPSATLPQPRALRSQPSGMVRVARVRSSQSTSGFPGGVASDEVIDYRWTVGRAFSAEPLPLALALGLLALGGVALYGLHRRAGVDESPEGEVSKTGEFAPTGAGQSEFRVVGDVRPGHVGTVADERVDPIDVTVPPHRPGCTRALGHQRVVPCKRVRPDGLGDQAAGCG